MELNLTWKVNAGNCSFGWDNWTEKGILATLFPDVAGSKRSSVKEYITGGQWNLEKLGRVDVQTVQHITSINIGDRNENDYATRILQKMENTPTKLSGRS